METPITISDTLTQTHPWAELQNQLQKGHAMADSKRKIVWDKVDEELHRLHQQEHVSLPPVKYLTRVLYRSTINKAVRGNFLRKGLFIRTLEVFLASREFQQLCVRFGVSPEEGRDSISPAVVSHWLALWLLHEYRQVSHFLLNPQQKERFSSLLDISFDQLVAYSPRFVLFRMPVLLRNPKQVVWIRWMARGKNLRKAPNLPFPVSKRMAHWVTQAPHYLNFKEAMLYGMVLSLRGNEALFQSLRSWHQQILREPILRQGFIRLFIRAELIPDSILLERLLGYITHRRDENPSFSLKGQNLAGLRRRMERWYDALHQENLYQARHVAEQWASTGIQGMEVQLEGVGFEIVEILTGEELKVEGRSLSHCVSTYSWECAKGYCSIWSMRKKETTKKGELVISRLVTIEVKEGCIVQARGKFNRGPNEGEVGLIEKWAKASGLEIRSY